MRSKFLIAAVLAVVSSSQVSASNSYSGRVSGFGLLGGPALVFTTGTRDTPPACSNPAYPGRFAFDASTPAGQALLSTLLTARAQNEVVSIFGTGTCSVIGDTETVGAIVTNNVQ